MALRLVRKSSDTPNITNKDDTIMTRYAYGGYNGVVKAFGGECGYTAENGVFKVLNGRIVVDGWEIDIDGAGYSFNFANVVGVQYCSVYVEINVLTESVDLKSVYATGGFSEIEKGDDLTSIPNGTAKMLLYNVKVENGAITEVVKNFEVIPYLTQKVLDIEKRLEELGFKQGNLVDSDGVAYENAVSKVGYYAIIKLEEIYVDSYAGDIEQFIFTLPNDFIPKNTQRLQETTASEDGYGINAVVYSNNETNDTLKGKLLIEIDNSYNNSNLGMVLPLFTYGYSLK